MKIIPVIYQIIKKTKCDITTLNELIFIWSIINDVSILNYIKDDKTVVSIELCEIIFELIKEKEILSKDGILITNNKTEVNVDKLINIYLNINFSELCSSSFNIDNLIFKLDKIIFN